MLWAHGITAPGRPPAGVTWVDGGDRASDDSEARRASLGVGHDFVFRVSPNRPVWSDAAQTRSTDLPDFARKLRSLGTDTVAIPARGGRAGREAKVALAAARVWIPASTQPAERAEPPVIAAWVERVWEPHPPQGVAAAEWIVVTSVESETWEPLKERRDWDACRWRVEVYHDVEKNGCGREARRFETADRMAACLAILSVVAVRVFALRTALDHPPQAGGGGGGESGGGDGVE